MNKKITVFMPVYNSERYLKEAIDSILGQSYKNFELLIINDGSTDSSLNIIKSYDDSRIKLINNNYNKGLPYTRNLGMKLAKGDYIAIMDSDDISYRSRLEKQMNFLEKNPDIDIVSSNFDELLDSTIIKSKTKSKSSDEVKIELMFRCCIGNPTVMMRKNSIINNKLKYRDECFVAQDYSFWVDSIKKCNFYHINESLIAYRTGHENITKKSTKYKSEQRKKIIDSIRERALINNGFILAEDELYYFNKVFSDPKIQVSVDDLKKVNKVLKKMVLLNSEQNIFNKKLFDNTIKYRFISRLCEENNIKLTDKFKIVLFKYKNESIKSFIISIIKILW